MSFIGGLGQRIDLGDVRRLAGARRTLAADAVPIVQPPRRTAPYNGDINGPGNCWYLVRFLAEQGPVGRFKFKFILI
jgi:hypothetical protein